MAVVLALGVLAAGCPAPVNYATRDRYPQPEAQDAAPAGPALLSAQISRYGDEDDPASGEETTWPPQEPANDRLVLVFSVELDALSVDPRSFGVLRSDGVRVSPRRAFLAPADEGDENRSLTLLGEFGGPERAPVTVHVLGPVFAENGEALRGLDAKIAGPEQADRPILVERLGSDEGRCPGATRLLRVHWSDGLAGVADDDRSRVTLELGSGERRHPVAFDDQAHLEVAAANPNAETPTDAEAAAVPPQLPSPGAEDDNVLDLCLDFDDAVRTLDFAAGVFTDLQGHPTAAAHIAM